MKWKLLLLIPAFSVITAWGLIHALRLHANFQFPLSEKWFSFEASNGTIHLSLEEWAALVPGTRPIRVTNYPSGKPKLLTTFIGRFEASVEPERYVFAFPFWVAFIIAILPAIAVQLGRGKLH